MAFTIASPGTTCIKTEISVISVAGINPSKKAISVNTDVIAPESNDVLKLPNCRRCEYNRKRRKRNPMTKAADASANVPPNINAKQNELKAAATRTSGFL